MKWKEICEALSFEINKGGSSPSQLEPTEPATRAGFSFLRAFGDKTGIMKYVTYKPAEIYRGPKKWFVFYSYRNPTTGKFKRFRVYEDLNRIKGRDKEQYAQLLKKAINHGLKSGYNPFEGDPFENIPLSIAVNNWTLVQGLNYFKTNLINRGLRKRTQQTYQSTLKFLYKYLQPILNDDIKNLTRHHIASAFRRAQQDNNWTNSTHNNNLTQTKAIFNYLVEEEILEKSPVKVKPLPETITKHKYFSDEVFKKIKDAASEDLLKFIMFLYHTGTRPNEARQIRYENILRDRKLLFIPASISKNKKDDYVPLTDFVLTNFVKTEGLIFPVSVNYYGMKFTELKKKLKLPQEYTLYSIKHTRAIHLAQDGANPYTIMQLFRHSGLEITMSYLRDLGVNINREAAEKGIRF